MQSPTLSSDLWQLIFKHLSLQERLRIRSVCKHFSSLDSEGPILVTTGLPSKLATDSLVLFLSRRSKCPAPALNLQLTGSASHLQAAVQEFLPSALRCSCLLHLGLGNLLLQPLEAALGLALLPSSLLSLKIRCASCIIINPLWSRLTALTRLDIKMRHQEQDHAELLECSGLCSLPNLTTLTVRTAQPFSMGKGILAKLRTLSFGQDPFQDPPTRATLPRLNSLCQVSSNHHLPAWMEGWPVNLLQVNSWFSLSNLKLFQTAM